MWDKFTELLINLMQFILSILMILGFIILGAITLPLLFVGLICLIIVGLIYWCVEGHSPFDKRKLKNPTKEE